MGKRRIPDVLRRRMTTPLAAIALTVLFSVAIAALAGQMIWQNYRVAIAAGEARAVSSAHVVAAHMEWMFAASDQALRRIDEAVESAPALAPAAAMDEISRAVGDLPAGFEYAIYDETGRLRLSSVDGPAETNIADRDYFQHLKNGEMLVVSPQLDERVTGEPAFIIARRITRNGTFQGVAGIAVPAAKMDEFWSSMGLGQGSTVSIVRDDGWVVARHPALAAPLNLSKAPLFTTYLKKGRSGFYHNAVSPADGRARIVGYWRVDGWPLIATAGVERSEALELFWSGLRSQFAFGLPLLAMLLVSGVWISRLLQAYALRNDELERAMEKNNFLLREIHHRVKNNLQTVSALVRLQPLPEKARADMHRRIAAMVAVHEQIYQNDQFSDVDVAPYAERLVREIAAGYPAEVNLVLDLAPVAVKPDHALPIGLIINEVVSNAFKHAFTEPHGGRLAVHLARQGDMARLTITDDGPGMPAEGGRTGMGSRLIGGFVSQLGGSYVIENDGGMRFSMTFPVSASAGNAKPVKGV